MTRLTASPQGSGLGVAGPATLEVDGTRLLRRGVEHRLLSGSVHYFRVHPELWPDRLRRVRAMGLNTIDTYVPWNWHEPEPGRTVFSGGRDVEAFLRLVGELGMDAVVRPGPYICAEWDNGGLPVWLTGRPDVRLRTTDPDYLAAVAAWFDELVPRLVELQANRGGPVVAVQVENEYGSYGDDHGYLSWLRDALTGRGVDELLFTADGPTDLMLDGGTVDGVLAAATFGSRPQRAVSALRERRDEPFLCAEFWNGWFDHWGERHHVREPDDAAADVATVLDLGGSLSLYMAHGGTNFGLWAGANHDGAELQPTVSSYDSDAPVAEDGTVTPKFFALREVLTRYPSPQVPSDALDERWLTSPARLPAAVVPVVACTAAMPVLKRLGTVRDGLAPATFEAMGQAAGLALYTAHPVLPRGESTVSVTGLRDRATVYLDGVAVGVLDRRTSEAGLTVRGEGRRVRLELLVENLGRVNYGPRLGEHKGIVGHVLVGRRIVHGWTSRSLPLDRIPPDALRSGAVLLPVDPAGGWDGGAVACADLHVEEPADTFLAMPGWDKGFVWVNDVLLGRYWSRGPQRTLYVPAPLLNRGPNTVTVLEMHHPGVAVELRAAPDLGEPEHHVEEL